MSGRSGLRRLLRLRSLTPKDSRQDVDDEMRLHVELRAAELVRDGMDPAAAETEARRLFARESNTLDALYATAEDRDGHLRLRERLESVVHDIRYAARSLAHDAALTGFIVVALALGVGASVTAFGLVDRLMFRGPAHVVEPERVIRLYGEVDFLGRGLRTSSYLPFGAYQQFRDARSFAQTGAYIVGDRVVGRKEEARRLRVGQTHGAFFQTLGARPAIGRVFDSREDAASTGALAILSNELWRTTYGSDPAILGGTIDVDEVPHTIVGVMPPGFTGTDPRRVTMWTLGSSATAGTRNWNVVGRLRDGVTAEAASSEVTAMHRPEASGAFAWFRDARIYAGSLALGDDGRLPLETTLARWLAAVTFLILLITFANVVNLLLARVTRRRRELAVRASLGAGRSRVMRLVASEGLLLALASGAAGLFVVRLLDPLVRRALFSGEADWSIALTDWRMLVIAGAVVLATAVCLGIAPAWQAGDHRLTRALRGGRHGAPASSTLRSGLTIVQAAFSVVMLIGAGLFLRSMANVNALDLGADADRVVAAEATLARPPAGSRGEYEIRVYRQLEAGVRRAPGVERAAIAIGLPLDGGSFSAAAWVPGRDSLPSMPGGGPFVSSVSAGYFDVVGTRIVSGRAFTDADREGSEPVVIVNEAMARALGAGGDVLDQCIHVGSQSGACHRVVGIAENVHRTGLREQPSFQYYLPLGQKTMFGGAQLVIRPVASGALSWDDLRRTIAGADPAVRAVELRTLADALAGELRPLRLGILTFGVSAALALIVAVLGLYSVMSYLVAWRTHEIGVRAALGATRREIVALVLRGGVALAATGVAVGLALALVAGRWLEPHLFETSAHDGPVMVAVAGVMLATAVLAGWLPARRATRISPTEALRAE